MYAFLQTWPRQKTLILQNVEPTAQTVVSLLGYGEGENFEWGKNPKGGISVALPVIPITDIPCDWIWTLKFTFVS